MSWKCRRPAAWRGRAGVSHRALALGLASAFVVSVVSCSVGDGIDPVEEVKVGTITIDSAPLLPLERGTHQVFGATVKDPKGKVITVPLVWRSSNEQVATFEPGARLLARTVGSTLISASALGVVSGTVPVQVKWEGAAHLAAFQWTAPAAATPGAVVSDSIRALVTNPLNAVAAGVRVLFAVTGGGGSVSPTTVSTTTKGVAATQWTLGPNAGANTLTATAVDDDNKPITWVTPNNVSFAVRSFTALAVVEGDAQTALILAKVPVKPAVRLVDSLGKPRLGVPVTFTPTKGGQVTSSIVSTGADGVASPGDWILGDIPGEQNMEVQVESAKLVLRATATGTPIHYTPTALAAGGFANCALASTGLASCWGEQPKVGDSTEKNRPSPTPTKGNISFLSIAGGPSHFCGVATDSSAYCWGINALADTTGKILHTATPTRILSERHWTQVAPGVSHTCALSERIPYCWGDNTVGQLGDRTTTKRFVPDAVYGGFQFSTIASGSNHTCGLTTSGSAFCWGFNANGQLGDGTVTSRVAPTVVTGALTFQSIGAGEGWSCALTTAGKVYCWGNVPGVNAQQTTPETFATAPVFTSLTVGGGHACALTGVGAAYCWGENSSGQLGDSSTVRRASPVPVAGGLKFSSLSAGYAHTCGRTTDGSVACWGLNRAGELGDSTSAFRLIPRFMVTGVIP